MNRKFLYLMIELIILIGMALLFVTSIALYDRGDLDSQLDTEGKTLAFRTEEAMITYSTMLKSLGYNFMNDKTVDEERFYQLAKFYKDRYSNIIAIEYRDSKGKLISRFPNVADDAQGQVDTILKGSGTDKEANLISSPEEIQLLNQQRLTLRIDHPYFDYTDAHKGYFVCWIDVKSLFDNLLNNSEDYLIRIKDDTGKIFYGAPEIQSILYHAEKVVIGSQIWTIEISHNENVTGNVVLKATGILLVILAMIISVTYFQYVIYKKDNELETINQELETSLNELTKSQERLVEAEKIAAMGHLVATVAHEINTPLGNCITTSSYSREKIVEFKTALIDKSANQRMLGEFVESMETSEHIVERNLHRIKLIVDRFKALAVKNLNEHVEVFDLYELSNEAVQRYRHLKPFTWSILSDGNLLIKGIRIVFEEILNNLISNSVTHGFASGMESNAHITIELRRMPSENGKPDMLMLIVSDNGCGVEKEYLKRIVEPLFSINKLGGSGGIGLNVIMNILNHTLEGEMHLDSDQNEGMCVTIKIHNIEWIKTSQ